MGTHTHTQTCVCVYIYIYIYMFIYIYLYTYMCIYIAHFHLNIFFSGYDFFFPKCYFSNNALQKYQTVRKIGWKRFMPLTVGVLY